MPIKPKRNPKIGNTDAESMRNGVKNKQKITTRLQGKHANRKLRK